MKQIVPFAATGSIGDTLPVALAAENLADVGVEPQFFASTELAQLWINQHRSDKVKMIDTHVSADQTIKKMRELATLEGARYFARELQKPVVDGILNLRERNNGEIPKTVVINQGGVQTIGGILAALRKDIEFVVIDPVPAPFAGMPYKPAQSIFPEFIPVGLQRL